MMNRGVRFSFFALEGIGNHLLLTIIYALAAQDAVGMFHITGLDFLLDIDAHRAVAGAGSALDA